MVIMRSNKMKLIMFEGDGISDLIEALKKDKNRNVFVSITALTVFTDKSNKRRKTWYI